MQMKKTQIILCLFHLRGLVDEVGTAIRNHNGHIFIPNLNNVLKNN